MAQQRATVYCTGWEALQTTSLADTPCNMGPGTWSVTATAAHKGNYGLRLNPTSSRSATALAAATTGYYEVIGQVWVCYHSFPSTNWSVIYIASAGTNQTGGGIQFNASTQKHQAWLRNESTNTDYVGSDGPALSLDTWYRLDFRMTRPDGVSNARRVIEWYQDGSAQTTLDQTTGLNTTIYIGAVRIGEIPDRGNTGTYDIYVDDCIVVDNATGDYPSFPMAPAAVYGQFPVSDGSHSNASSFTDDAANSPPASVYDRIDEVPSTSTTDYVGQTTAGASDYLEVQLTDAPDDWGSGNAYAEMIRWANNASGAYSYTGSNPPKQVYHIGSTSYTRSFTTLSTTLTRQEEGHSPGSSQVITKAEASAARFTFGYTDDVTPVPRLHQAYAEVGYPFSVPSEGEGWDILMA